MKRAKLLLTTASAILISSAAFAQSPAVAWSAVYGGNRGDEARAVRATTDGGFIIAGHTNSTPSGDVSERIGNKEGDIWIVKTDAAGAIEWEKVYGGTEGNEARSIQLTKDGGYIVVGESRSQDGDISNPIGHIDIWVVKLNDTGKIEWDKSFGYTDQDAAGDIKQTADGGYIVIGTVNNYGRSGAGHNSDDILVAKLSATGTTEWEKYYGGTGYENGNAIIQTLDGGYLIGGASSSTDGDVTAPADHGNGDVWIAKLDPKGSIEWSRILGGSKMEQFGGIAQASDSGYVILANTQSDNGSGEVVRRFAGVADDLWVIKLDKTGQNIVWNKSYGGSSTEYVRSITNTSDGGFILSSTTHPVLGSGDGDATGQHGGHDFWMVKLDGSGELEWVKAMGGTEYDEPYDIQPLSDGGYIAVGFTQSTDDDLSALTHNGDRDYWLIRLEAPDTDSLRVTTQGNVAATITTAGGTLDLNAVIYPRVLPQDVTWSITAGTGTATISAAGLVTAQTDGTVWGRAVSVADATIMDSIEITISGQTTPPDPESVSGINADIAVSIYPNPVNNLLFVQAGNAHETLKLAILNIDGKVVYQTTVPANALQTPLQIDVNALANGVYMLRLDGETIHTSKTIAKQ